MFKNSKTKSILIAVCSAAAVLLAIYVFIFVYTIQTDDQLSGGSGQLQVTAQNNAKFFAKEELLRETTVDRNKISSYILNDQDPVSFIEQVEDLGKTAGVTLNVDSVDNAPLPNDSKSKWEYLSLKISTKGSWQQTFNLLSMLEHLPYQADIKDLNLGKEPGNSKKISEAIWDGLITLIVLKSK